MSQYVTAKQMKEIEYQAYMQGIPYLTMMENAGKSAFKKIVNTYPLQGKLVVVLVGKGNNGGDGYVVARYLKKTGCMVLVIMAEGLPVTDDAKTNFQRCTDQKIEVVNYEPGITEFMLDGADYIIDAIYGAGFHGRFREPIDAIARKVNESDAKVIALDLPSGLNADTGEADPHAISADLTITFARWKLAHNTTNGQRLCGESILTDIGI
ncbi:MAG: NAD(P)H-hydrate epimerase [Clostridia bacterium]|nr:NAD(P)H-hydrate epimerase [Clostridia bacterium]